VPPIADVEIDRSAGYAQRRRAGMVEDLRQLERAELVLLRRFRSHDQLTVDDLETPRAALG